MSVAVFEFDAGVIPGGRGDIIQHRTRAGWTERQLTIPSVCLAIRSSGVGEAVEHDTAAHIADRGGREVDEGLGLERDGLECGASFAAIGEIVGDGADVPDPAAEAALEEA